MLILPGIRLKTKATLLGIRLLLVVFIAVLIVRTFAAPIVPAASHVYDEMIRRMLLENPGMYLWSSILDVTKEEILFRLWLVPNPVLLISGGVLVPFSVLGVLTENASLFWIVWFTMVLMAVVVRLRGQHLFLLVPSVGVRKRFAFPVVWSALWFSLAHITAYAGNSGSTSFVLLAIFLGALIFECMVRVKLGFMQCIAIHLAKNALIDHGKNFFYLLDNKIAVAFIPAAFMIVCCSLAATVFESRISRPSSFY
jgi:hypothetical protein